jgi:hypothetical protein
MSREPGSLLLHPVHLIAVAVLGVNDYWLKDAWPGAISGKLSDVVGLIVLPIVVLAAAEMLLRRPIDGRAVRNVAVVCAAGFAAVKTWHPATQMFAVGLGWVQWLFTGADGMAHAVAVTADTSDLLALPATAIPVMLAVRRQSSTSRSACSHRASRDVGQEPQPRAVGPQQLRG